MSRHPFVVRRGPLLVVVALLMAALSSAALADAPGVPVPPDDSGKAAAAKDPAEPAAREKPHLIVLPIIFYTPETRLAFGAGAMVNYRFGRDKKNTRPSSLGFLGVYTLNDQIQLTLNPVIYLPGNKFVVDAELQYERYPQDFYGIGNDVPDSARESYTPEIYGFKLGLRRKVFGSVFLGANYQIEKTDIEEVAPGGALASGTIPGSHGGLVSGLGLSLSWDDRDNVFFPRRGSYIQLGADFYTSWLGSDYSYSGTRLDLRTYLPCFETQVLAFKLYLSSLGGGPAPFYHLYTLGGAYMLRGVYAGKYRDQAQLTVLAEYRFPVWKRLSAAGFTGVGNVGSSLGELFHNSLKVSAGAGLRFKLDTREGINVRLDYAWCSGSTGFYATIQEAF